MKYYVIYKTKDFCKKYKHCYYNEEEVGKESKYSKDFS